MGKIKRDVQPVGNTSLTSFDVLILGSGAGGGSAASILAQNGLKVLILEAGPNYFSGLDNSDTSKLTSVFANDELKLMDRYFIHPDPLAEPRTFRKTASTDPRSFTGEVNSLPKTVGGATIHADLKMPRFIPTDFHLGTLIGQDWKGANFADWPVDYDMLEPFYCYAEQITGVQGIAGLNPLEGPRSKAFPMKPGVPMLLGLKAFDAARSLGYNPFPYPTAVTSQVYDGRAACVDCGFCSGFGCPVNAKGSSAVTTLRKALLTGNVLLLPETRAVRLITKNANEVVGVEAIGPDGSRQQYQADRYVLAASPIEDARLLLLSVPEGLGNSSGCVGRNLMFHCQTIVAGTFNERLHPLRGRTVTHGMADFRGVPGHPKRPLGGIIEFAAPDHPIDEAMTYFQQVGLRGSVLRNFIQQSPMRDRFMVLIMQGEDAPQLTNTVDLDPEIVDFDGIPVPRITYSPHAFELNSRSHYLPKMLELLGKAGAKYSFVSPLAEIPTSSHVMGTLRMGADPKTSVCDPTGKMHDVGNLFVADGALFPTASGLNPTLTITALSSWVAGSMVFPGSPAKALPS